MYLWNKEQSSTFTGLPILSGYRFYVKITPIDLQNFGHNQHLLFFKVDWERVFFTDTIYNLQLRKPMHC